MITKKKDSLIISAILFLAVLSLITFEGAREIWPLFYLPLFFATIGGGLIGAGAIIALTSVVLYFLQLAPLFAITANAGGMIALSYIFSKILEREKKTQDELATLSMVDRLTGLRNYSYFIGRLEEEKERVDRHGGKFSLAMMDIDFFKALNDEYGHAEGNIFLKELADIFKKEMRVIDVVARYGGEEFAMVFPETDEETAKSVAERIRKVVAKTNFSITGGRIRKTISAGVATYPDQAKNELDLIDKADEALYMAKNSGRNKVCSFSEVKPLS